MIGLLNNFIAVVFSFIIIFYIEPKPHLTTFEPKWLSSLHLKTRNKIKKKSLWKNGDLSDVVLINDI